MELLTSWEEKGMQKEGLTIVRRLLIRRIGPLAPELETRLQGLSLAEVEALGEALLDFAEPADLEAWLAAHPG